MLNLIVLCRIAPTKENRQEKPALGILLKISVISGVSTLMFQTTLRLDTFVYGAPAFSKQDIF